MQVRGVVLAEDDRETLYRARSGLLGRSCTMFYIKLTFSPGLYILGWCLNRELNTW